MQAAFHKYYGAQCGFCTPGFLLATHALLQRTKMPDRREIERALAGHTCRCTGYVKILEAVEGAVRGDVGDFELMPERARVSPK